MVLNLIFIFLNIPLIVSDFKKRILNNTYIFLILILGVIHIFTVKYWTFNILAALIFSLPLLGLYLYNKELIGGGDIKYLFVSGLFLGLERAIIVWFVMLSLATIYAIFVKIKGLNKFVPLGAFIGIGNIIISIVSILKMLGGH